MTTRSDPPESAQFPPQWALAFALAPQANPPTWEYAVAGAAVVALAAWLLNSRARVRSLQREGERTRVEAARMQAELERSVAARTAELAAAVESLRRERRLFVAGPVTVFRWVAAEGWPVEYVSPNVVGLFGCSDDDLMSGRLGYAKFVHPEDIERVAREVAEHSEARVPFFEQDYRIVRTDGEVRWLYDFTVVVRDDAGKVTHYEGYVLDQTDRKHAEEERRGFEERLQHSQKLESLGVLAGGIAHDFNNLLVGMLGNAEMLLKRLPADAPERQSVIDIELAARRAAELTRQMLAYAGRAPFVLAPLDLGALVREIAHLLEATLSKKARLEFQLADALPRVLGDPSQIRQVVMNLITNASDSLGDDSGRVVMRARAVEADEMLLAGLDLGDNLVPGPYVVLEVRDDGCGMDALTRKRMFEPFFTTKFAGRGLGLASVLGIVRAHHGGIAVESAPGRGTTVRVFLPVVPSGTPVRAGDARPEGDDDALPPTTVLVIDDEPAVRTVAGRTISGLGLDVLTANDGEQAIAVFRDRSEEIGCVLLDLTMPRLNGVETLAGLRRIRMDVPVILTSGYNEIDIAERVQGRPVDGFLQKPFTPAELERKLRDALLAKR